MPHDRRSDVELRHGGQAMKRSSRQKVQAFLLRMRHEYRRCMKAGRYGEARRIKAWLRTHAAMIGVKEAA